MTTKGPEKKRRRGDATLTSMGQRLAWLLVVRRLTQVEAAELAGISQSAIANLIRSATRQPSAKTLLGLAQALGTSPQFLLKGEGPPIVDGEPGTTVEQQLLSQFRKLPAHHQAHVVTFIKVLRGSADPSTAAD